MRITTIISHNLDTLSKSKVVGGSSTSATLQLVETPQELDPRSLEECPFGPADRGLERKPEDCQFWTADKDFEDLETSAKGSSE